MSVIIANEAALAIINRLKEIKADMKKLEKIEDELKNELHGIMTDHEELVTDDGEVIATWKYSNDVEYFDTKKFQTEDPIAYATYLATKPGSRRLLLK